MIWRSGRLLDEGSIHTGNRPGNEIGARPPGQSWTMLVESASRGPSRGSLGAIGAPIGLGLGMASVLILAFGAATT